MWGGSQLPIIQAPGVTTPSSEVCRHLCMQIKRVRVGYRLQSGTAAEMGWEYGGSGRVVDSRYKTWHRGLSGVANLNANE